MIRIRTVLGLTYLLVLMPLLRPSVEAGTPGESAERTASLEVRIVKDSSGCPIAVDLWLASTSDTIKGLEAVVSWDRPDFTQFAPFPISVTKPDTSALSVLLRKAANDRDRAMIDTSHSLLSGWEFLHARLQSQISVKIVGVATFLGQRPGIPIPPGMSGLLCRFALKKAEIAADASTGDSATVSLGRESTRLSDPKGRLFTQLKLKQDVTRMMPCPAGKR